MNIFVTGATGFIGRAILSQLQNRNYNIIASSLEDNYDADKNENVKWLIADLNDINNIKDDLKIFNPDVVIHLAWQGIPDYSEKVSVINLNNSINLLDFIIEETDCKKIIVAGSCFEYGKKVGVCNENDSVEIINYLSWAKHSLYNYLLLKCSQQSVELIWFRIFYLYGPGQRKASLLPYLIDVLQNDKVPELKTPFNRNDFIYIDDVVEAFIKATEISVDSGIYNLGSGSTHSVYEFCEITESILKKSLISKSNLKKNTSGEQIDFWADIKKVKKAFGWVPKWKLKDGIQQMVINSYSK
jgi:UDP-glucose 4-epimerase